MGKTFRPVMKSREDRSCCPTSYRTALCSIACGCSCVAGIEIEGDNFLRPTASASTGNRLPPQDRTWIVIAQTPPFRKPRRRNRSDPSRARTERSMSIPRWPMSVLD